MLVEVNCDVGVDVNIPLDTDNEDKLVLSWNVVGTILLGETSKTDLLALSIAVLLDVLLSTLEDDTTLLLVGLIIESVEVLAQDVTRVTRLMMNQTRKMVKLRTTCE